MNKTALSLGLALFIGTTPLTYSQDKTVFQTGGGWRAEIDLRSDAAIVYGVNDSFAERVNSWRERGYQVQMMTGSAWGEYQDYIDGRFDGVTHHDEGQVQRDGEMIMHGPTVPYMVPTPSFIAYLKHKVKLAIDAGVTAIHLEEPEFWNRAGYSEGFKREWQAYYNEPWQAQHTSPDATYRSAKLKSHLYFRVLNEVFTYAKEYSRSLGREVQCYVPTHTLINYSAWGIVSPESNLAEIPGMDGYIAQVWTGTARTPTYFRGVEKERTFENAYLEYASMIAMTQPTGRRVYFLTDPIEDNPNYSWDNYKKNYEDTFVAQLLHPSIEHYEVMPWPQRIFLHKYKTAGSDERERIPAAYATQILTMINALNDIKAVEEPLTNEKQIGVLISDTMMFQRFPTHEGYEDPRLSNFYGMALPLVKRGVPVRLTQMENLLHPQTLAGLKILVMSYANMKPMKPEYHRALVDWVKQGNGLLYLGRDQDPFQQVREWWNLDGNQYASPSQHLFETAGIQPEVDGDGSSVYEVGDGLLMVARKDPKDVAMVHDENGWYRNTIERLANGLKERNALESSWSIQEKNYFHVQRGMFDVTAVMDECESNDPYTITGPVIDLLDAELPVLHQKTLQPGERALLINLNRIDKQEPQVLASASRSYDEVRADHSYSFVAKSPSGTQSVTRVLLPNEPESIAASDSSGNPVELVSDWDEPSRTVRLRFPNHPDGVHIAIRYR